MFMFLKQKIKYKSFRFLLGFFLFSLLAISYALYVNKVDKISDIQTKIEKKLREKEKSLNQLLDIIEFNIEENNFDKIFSDINFITSYYAEGIFFYYYSEDHLRNWSTNSVPISNSFSKLKLNNEIWQLKNGIYLQKHRKIPNSEDNIVVLSLIKNNFVFENNYLSNTFHNSFNLCSCVKLSITETDNQIFSSDGNYLFSIYKDGDVKDEAYMFVIIMLVGMSFVFLLLLFDLYIKNLRVKRSKKTLIYLGICVFVFLMRLLSFVFTFPASMYENTLFSPVHYASSDFLPSLGDILLNSIVVFIVVFIFFFRIKVKRFSGNSKLWRILNCFIAVILLSTIPLLFAFLFNTFKGLVLNSNILLETENLFKLNLLSYIAFLIFAILLAIFYIVTLKVFIIAKHFIRRIKTLYVLFAILSIVSFIYIFFQTQTLQFSFLTLLSLFLLFYLSLIFKSRKFANSILILILLSSLFTTITLNVYTKQREHDLRLFTAMKIANEHDPILEYRMTEILKEIPDDEFLSKQFNNVVENEARIIDYITEKYFGSFQNNYKILITICLQNQNLNIQPENYDINCNQYFRNKLNIFGSYKLNNQIWYMSYEPGMVSYFGSIKIKRSQKDSNAEEFTIFFELDSKSYINDIGYPELLIDKRNTSTNPDISNYSYARYYYDDLVSQYGKFFYSTNLSTYNIDKKEPNYFENNGYKHLIYKANEKETIIIGKRINGVFENTIPISLFIFFYGFLIIIFLLITGLFSTRGSFIMLNFKTKLQFAMILTLISSFIIIGFLTVFYFFNMNIEKNKEIVAEKSHTILIQMEQNFNYLSEIGGHSLDQINDLILKLSRQLFVDINLYNRQGHLISSSRPQMYQHGLISRRINTEAFLELRANRETIFMHNETIGKQSYLSSYMPLRNNVGNTIAYINIPYFAQQEDVNKEVSNFMVAFLSVYFLIIIIAIIIAIIFSRYITRPLELMKRNIGQIKLRGSNKKIEWKSKDEIGELILEYNRMVDELALSAEKLASSERDYAWREMAQQVAHEIKNPLTPMKLNIQYLQRAWQNQEEDWGDRLERFAQSLVEQIDTLSDIATSFSDFAKMPKGSNSKENLVSIISSVILLFQEEDFDINFEFSDSSLLIEGDKNQLIRVFNNLIKNATQALRGVEGGKINIAITKETQSVLVRISDNGVGIPEDLKPKIFYPNFTTKSSGTGLGLAMVKNIVESMGGSVWFNSKEGRGTEFYVSFPYLSE